MYITGGIGAVPGSEGFGNDYELDPEYAYAETCAALGCLFWNWEMAQLTGEAKYSDLFEWQLYNAAAVGMGWDGTSYLYNNPLACRGGVVRQPWYAVPCCPSNLSRTWADLGRYIFSTAPGRLYVHQYISSQLRDQAIPGEAGGTLTVSAEMVSGLPWEGRLRIRLAEVVFSNPGQPKQFELYLRQPAWSGGMQVAINGNPVKDGLLKSADQDSIALGYDPQLAVFQTIRYPWSPDDVIQVAFDAPIRLRRAHPKVKGHQGKVAVTRGPLVYCLEDVDNPEVDLFTTALDPDSLEALPDGSLLGGIVTIKGQTRAGQPLTFIPYFLWGNRGPSQMTVWVAT